MLLVIDVGNTNTVLALTQDHEVKASWRISTRQRTTDEFGLDVLQLLRHEGYGPEDVSGVILGSVVPSQLYAMEKASRRYLGVDALVVGKGLKTGMRVDVDNPREVGSDRIVNAVAAVERWGAPILVVDFGTATTLDCVNEAGAYVGGVIAPGLQISAEALFQRTAKLPRVEVQRPRRAIGRNTIESIQSGLYYGYVGLVDNLARACKQELGTDVKCIGTGGLSNLIGRACAEIDIVDPDLTVRGLSLLFSRNSESR